VTHAEPVSPRQFWLWLFAILVVAALVRGLYPAADPPWRSTVGVVWHDEGAWVHNARNRALFGTWMQDSWNPVFIAPVFTALEYVSFATFGVGVRQARLVPEVLGLASVLLIGLGVARIGGRFAGLVAAALLATNYVYVMWNRAALMEGPMAAFMVASWYCYTRAEERPVWGAGAAAGAVLAFFTKAAAAFFVAALVLDALTALLVDRDSIARRRAIMTLAGLVLVGGAAAVTFVLPNWNEYWFYNVQMSVTRKPTYDLQSVINRVTWFPILHDLFTRLWFTLLLAAAGLVGTVTRWRAASPGERLLVLWVILGTVELLVHDVGNERRFVFFIPAFVGIAALVLARDRGLLPVSAVSWRRRAALVAAPLLGYLLYVIFGSFVRLAYLYEVRPNVRLAAFLALAALVALYATWPVIPRALAVQRWSTRIAVLLTSLIVAGQLAQYVQWAGGRTYENYEASRMLAEAS
jgi:4-amino-4-deoxy-L-arabinose transferase-like glycosyltransferase